MESPNPCQKRRCHAKCNRVRERIQLFPEFTGRVRHPRNAAIKRVKREGKANGHRGNIQVMRPICVSASSQCIHRLGNRIETQADATGSKQRRQKKHPPLHTSRAQTSPAGPIGSLRLARRPGLKGASSQTYSAGRRHRGKYRRTALDANTLCHSQFRFNRQNDIHPRAKFDQPDKLSAPPALDPPWDQKQYAGQAGRQFA